MAQKACENVVKSAKRAKSGRVKGARKTKSLQKWREALI